MEHFPVDRISIDSNSYSEHKAATIDGCGQQQVKFKLSILIEIVIKEHSLKFFLKEGYGK